MAKNNSDLAKAIEAKNGNGADKPKSLPDQLAEYLRRGDVIEQIQAHGLKFLTPERLTRLILTQIRLKPELAECTLPSHVACLMLAAQFELEIGTPQCYIIKRNRNIAKKGQPAQWVAEAEFQIGYQGYVELIHRANPGCRVAAHPIHAKDKFLCRHGYNEELIHEPAFPERGELVGFYAYFVRGEQRNSEVINIPETDDIKSRSKSRDKDGNVTGPWITDYPEMGRKSALRRLQKWIPKTPLLQKANNYLGLDIETEQRQTETITLNAPELPALDAPATKALPAPLQAFVPDPENYSEGELAELLGEAGTGQQMEIEA